MVNGVLHPLFRVDEQLVRDALLKAGSQIHGVTGLVAMYRAAAADSPATAVQLEKSLRRFVATGRLHTLR